MVFPDPKEKAVLTIRGQDYSEWETIQVRHTKKEAPYYTFRLTCSEGQPIASNRQTLQIVPGDDCTITLAGILAFTGKVFSRQVFYDAKKHYIEIQGASNVLQLSYAHVVHESMEFNNKTAKEICTALCKPHGVNFTEEGGALPSKKIESFRVAPGTTVLEAVETVLRSTGGTELTSNLQHDLVAAVGPVGDNGIVTEGVDILEGREIIFHPGISKHAIGEGQAPGTDQKWGPDAAQIHKQSGVAASGGIAGNLKQVIPFEMPAFSEDMLGKRADMDRNFQNGEEVTVYATVQGWLKPGGGLWDRNANTRVKSPMLIMNGSEPLKTKSVTFTQDNSSGTRTVLELCNDIAWGPGTAQTGGAP